MQNLDRFWADVYILEGVEKMLEEMRILCHWDVYQTKILSIISTREFVLFIEKLLLIYGNNGGFLQIKVLQSSPDCLV